ncbi:FecR domain-containing protein [Pseudomonas sp. UL073]|uniref:FecR domain-containing protein n=1 Tax=Zestomonas insulae TaxID=2809017 RepID=A0ABS2IIF8_9GAMM|nr:FecR domain-containing protein [Pseudomonas insulae]MBM7062851.1 FecR domain-containing protein [Pseudomonas insulae]
MSSPREQAALWFARMQNAADDHPQRAQFEAWLAAHPQHAVEYQAFCELWGDFSSTRRSEALAQAMEQRQRRRQFLHSGLCALLLALGGTFGWHGYRQSSFELDLATTIGTQQETRLRDGSQLTLNADTRLHLHFDRALRQVELLRGEAIFDVARNPQRPFVIDGGVAKVRVLGTRFVVNRLDQRLRVSVERGLVQVDSLAKPGESLQVRAGEVLEVDRHGHLRRLPLAASNAFAFQRGSLVFEQADLTEIAASLSRYRQQPVQAELGTARSPRISAVVQLADVEGFLQALPAIAPVHLQQGGKATVLQPQKTTARRRRE